MQYIIPITLIAVLVLIVIAIIVAIIKIIIIIIIAIIGARDRALCLSPRCLQVQRRAILFELPATSVVIH